MGDASLKNDIGATIEDQWRGSLERFRSLVEGLGDKHSVFFHTPEGKITYASPSCEKIFGEDANSLVGKDWDCLRFDEDSRRRGKEASEKIQESLESTTMEMTCLHSDGTERTMEAHLGPVIEHGKVILLEWICFDITAYRRTEKALEKRLFSMTQPLSMTTTPEIEELFDIEDLQKLQDDFALATGVASIITKVDGTPVTRPGAFTRFCLMVRATSKGCANCQHSDAVLGKLNVRAATVQACLSGGLWDAGAGISVGGVHIANWLIGQVRDESLNEGKIREYARQIGADEEQLVVACNEIPAMSEEKFRNTARALHTLATQLSTLAFQNMQQARFIAERKRVERMLSEYSKELEQIVYVASHDLRSPLVNIRGFGQELEESLRSLGRIFAQRANAQEALASEWNGAIDEASDNLRMIRTGAEHLSDLLNGLLKVSRMRYENLTMESVDMNGLLAKLKDSFAFECNQYGVDLHLAAPFPACYGDTLQVGRIFSNLIANAIKFRSSGRPCRIDIAAQDLGHQVQYWVRDNGRGIPANQLESVFKIFYRSHPRETEGEGLGLTIVRQILDRLGGSIELESEYGVGTLFKVVLPKAAVEMLG